MISLVLYCLSFATILVLYYFYKPSENENESNEEKTTSTSFSEFLKSFFINDIKRDHCIDDNNIESDNQINDSFKYVY
jgi:hypothetical protein